MAYSPDFKGIQLSVADDELSCPVCCAVFQEPKLLPNCAHSFCKDCLRDLTLHSSRSSKVSCPVCRKISSLPRNGVEGLATNTLLVRLIDNIPGRKEKEAIVKALKRCKEVIQKSKNVQDDLEKNLSQIREYKEQGMKLKKEISEHAQKAVDSIRKWEQDCHKEVDSYLSQNCGLDFYERFNNQSNKRRSHINEATACIQSAEKMLKRDKISEILAMKDLVEAQLNEYSSVPQCTLLQEARKVQGFHMKLEKKEFQLNLGNLSSSVSCSNSGSTPTGIKEPPFAMNAILEDQISLEFEPFSMALCPRSGQIALLWKERRQVYLYSQDLDYMGKIIIKYGDLWDVGFTIDDEVVVVNRAHNRLLLYEKNGCFIDFDVIIPRDNLKFTYISVDDEGRLIVTSTKVEHDEDDEFVVPCITVYSNGIANHTRMFGKRHLEKPISRAVFLGGKFYVADECDGTTFLKVFTTQGQHVRTITILSWFRSVSTVQLSGVVAMHTGLRNECKRNFAFLINGHIKFQRWLACPFNDLKQALVLSGEPNKPVEQLEIYRNKRVICKVLYVP